ncbi:MAG: sigma-54 dependent transcriptional regulator [Pseudomonadota bacterium]
MSATKNPDARLRLSTPVSLEALGGVLETLKAKSDARQHEQEIVGDSEAMSELRQIVAQVAPSNASVLISGESGTGKEVVARQLHKQSGRQGPFVAVNCGAIPDELLESELFGHEKGAFTGASTQRIGKFEQAEGGTLFLDEIGDMPPAMQVKLLRVLQERVVERVGAVRSIPIDVRVVTATHRDLQSRIKEGQFREDLFYRLNVVDIELTPLRARPQDLDALVQEMIRRVEKRHGIDVMIGEDARQAMQAYGWPGNVRELGNVIERLAVSKPYGTIFLKDLPVEISGVEPAEAPPAKVVAFRTDPTVELPDDGVDLKAHIASVERDLIEDALRQTDGIVAQAAKLLGVQRTTLVEKIKRFGLQT